MNNRLGTNQRPVSEPAAIISSSLWPARLLQAPPHPLPDLLATNAGTKQKESFSPAYCTLRTSTSTVVTSGPPLL